MARIIQIDGEGDGAWIMRQVTGTYDPARDHSILALDDDKRLGGFAFCTYLGASMTMHMAGVSKRWMSRDLLWMAFDYPFNQLGVRVLLMMVRSDNHTALAQDLRAGCRIEAVIQDAYPDAHMVVLSMRRETCPWLKLAPKAYKSNQKQDCSINGQG